MPDWLNEDLPEPEPTESDRRSTRRQRRTDSAARYRSGTSPGGFLLAAVLVLALVLFAAWIVPAIRGDADTPASGPTPQASTPGPQNTEAIPAASPSAGSSPTAATTGPSVTPRALEGDDLARTWIEGYLTRPDGRDDPRWETAIADITTPALLAKLRDEGPDAVGLFALTHWRVVKIEPWTPKDSPGADTPTRQVSTFAATVTDDSGKEGHTLVRKFILTAYSDEQGRWLIAMAVQPYESEG